MMTIGRIVLRFAWVMIAVLVAMAALWTWIAPGYGWAVATISEPIFHGVESPDVTTVETRGAEIWMLRAVPGEEPAPFTWFDRYAFWALIPLVALLCATPGLGLRRRLVRLAIGVGALMAVQSLYLVASVELAYAVVIHGRTLGSLQILVRVLWEAAPIAIWLALTAGTWRETWDRARLAQMEMKCPSRKSKAVKAAS